MVGGDRREEVGRGGSVFPPIGISHRIEPVGPDPVRQLMLITPPGQRTFFDEQDRGGTGEGCGLAVGAQFFVVVPFLSS